jgi:hypothetical protein
MSLIPLPSSQGDLFFWQVATDPIPSNVIGTGTYQANGRVQVASDKFFLLESFAGSTNYDNVAGDFIAVIGGGPASARTLVSPPIVPNNFEVAIKFNDDLSLTGAPIPQAVICSNGYFSGQQLPYPLLFAPMTTFNFEFFNVAPTLLKKADKTTAIDLVINFGLVGYFLPQEQLANFLAAYPGYAAHASAQPGWLAAFTGLDLPVTVYN